MSEARNYFDKQSKPRWTAKVDLVKDSVIESGTHKLKVRTYHCKPLNSNTTILYAHGGGFIYGGLESHDSICRLLAKRTGLRVVAIDYRLAPEYPYPAAVEDSRTTLEWLANSEEAPQHFILAGDSAGANILLYLALSQPKITVSGLVLIYPALDPSLSSASMETYKTGYFLTRDDMRQFWQMYLDNASATHKWPLSTRLLSSLPPTLIIGAGHDVLRDEGAAFSKQVKDAGVQARYVCYDDMVHGFMHWPRMTGKRDETLNEIAAFCKELAK